MAKKLKKTYQVVIQDAADQAFIKRLLEIYGYEEGEPGVFSEKPVPEVKPKTISPKSKSTGSHSAVATRSKTSKNPFPTKKQTDQLDE